MNKTFKTLFTLFLGIFLIISTFTANSAESLGEQLIKLEGLYERGSITKEEFSKAKTILLKMDTASSDKIEEVKKELSEKEKVKRVALLTTIESEVNQTKLYTTTEVKKYASGGKNTWEKTEFFFDDYRVYAHRPGAIKIRMISDGKQVAILSGKFKIKYRNGGEDLFETKSYKENVLDKKKSYYRYSMNLVH